MDNKWNLAFGSNENCNLDNGTAERAFSAGTVELDKLTVEEKKKVEAMANAIDIANVEETVRYGSEAQSQIADFSVSVLEQVRTADLGDIGKTLRDLTVQLDSTTDINSKGLHKVFKNANKSIDAVKANFAKAEDNVTRIENDMNEHLKTLANDISMYQEMYSLNIQYYRELTLYIIAGKKALDDSRKTKLEALRNQADLSGQPEDVQMYRDFSDLCDRFEKKINDLELTRMISIQSAPQIRLLQNNDREMLDKIQSSLANTIPLWRNQMVLALGIEHSKRAADAQNELSMRTSRLLDMNAQKLKMATVETAKAIETPIVDIETLKRCNTQLIDSLNEVVKIHNAGAQKQDEIKKELISIENELKQALMKVQRY